MLRLFQSTTSGSLAWALLCTILVASTGCSMFTSKTTSDPVAPTTTGANAPYTVEMHLNFSKPQYFHGQLGENTTVQSALEESGAIDKYRDMTIHLVRRVPEKSTTLRLPITFNLNRDKVEDQTDYQLHMGDRIVIMPKNVNPITGMMKMVGIQ